MYTRVLRRSTSLDGNGVHVLWMLRLLRTGAMTIGWRSLLMLWCLATCSSGQRATDFYTTVTTLSDLIDMEKHVKADLVRYVEHLKVVQDSILNFVQDRQPYDDLTSPSAVFDYLKHPVHAFHLIKRMTADLGAIEAQINKTQKFDPLMNIREMRKQQLLPRNEDFKGLAASLVRLQDTYSLDLHELTKGNLHTEIPRNRTIPGRLPLSALDCLNISQVALNESFYDRAVEWAEQAIAKAADEEPATVPKEELDAHHEAAVKQHDEVLITKGATGYLWQTYGVSVENRTHRSTEFKTELFQEQLPHDQEMQNYKRLCRGELLRTPKMDSKLRCRYYKGHGGSFTLHPIKLEEVNLKPYIVVMHDVIQDGDIEDLRAFAEPRLQTSLTYDVPEVESPAVRTSSNTWMDETNAPVARKLNKFLRSLLGLGTSYSDGEAEKYQLANYGTGGHFLTHPDYLGDLFDNATDPSEFEFHRKVGDRVATLMIYMSDVEEGGATVFPYLGVRLTPQKGDAAFWWNLKANGEGEVLTTHAGCPVLYGSKWIANKWFLSNCNTFRLPCSTDQNASLAPFL